MKQLYIFLSLIFFIANGQINAETIVETFTGVEEWQIDPNNSSVRISPTTGLSWHFDNVRFYDDYIYLFISATTTTTPALSTTLSDFHPTHLSIGFGEFAKSELTLSVNDHNYNAADGITANATLNVAIPGESASSINIKLIDGYISIRSITITTADESTERCSDISEWIMLKPHNNATIATSATIAYTYNNSIWVIDDTQTALEVIGPFNTELNSGDIIAQNFAGHQSAEKNYPCMIADKNSFSRIGQDATVAPVVITADAITDYPNRMIEIDNVIIEHSDNDDSYTILPGQIGLINISATIPVIDQTGSITGFTVTDNDGHTALFMTRFIADNTRTTTTDVYNFSDPKGLSFSPQYDPDESLVTITGELLIENTSTSITANATSNTIWIFPSQWIMFNNGGSLTFTPKDQGKTITEIRIYPHTTPSSELKLSYNGIDIPYKDKCFTYNILYQQSRSSSNSITIDYTGAHLNVDSIELDTKDLPTGIPTQTSETIKDNKDIYTLQGIRINETTCPGIYIVRDGISIRKVIIH